MRTRRTADRTARPAPLLTVQVKLPEWAGLSRDIETVLEKLSTLLMRVSGRAAGAAPPECHHENSSGRDPCNTVKYVEYIYCVNIKLVQYC